MKKNSFKRLCWLWIRFWGSRYRIIKNDSVIQEVLIYKKRIYLLENKEE